MALLHPFNFLAAAHPFVGAFANALHHHMRSVGEPEVIETENGYMFIADAPGVNAADTAVKAVVNPGASSATLSIKSTKGNDYIFHLPATRVDLTNITASCIHGVLRVAVPKVPVTEHSVPISASFPAHVYDDRKSNDDLTLPVPGFAPSDISVVIQSTGKLVVEGKSDRHGHFKKRFSLDRAVTSDFVSASCADGLLHIAIAPTLKDAELSVPVASEQEPVDIEGEDDDTPAARVTLVRQPVPGIGAEDLSVTVKDGAVHVSGKVDQSNGARCCFRRVQFAVRLPAGAEAASVAASCEHGVLTVTCASPAAPAEFEVAVSPDELAFLPAAEHEEGKGKRPAD